MPASKTLTLGDTAPDFTLPTADGQPVSLADYRGRPVVVYFYPKDDTPGCTAEACAFRDHYQDFTQAGAEVIGISSDDPASHARFANKHRLPFVLLSDPGGAVRKAYGVPATLGLLPGRVTFVLDGEAAIRHMFSSQLRARQHVAEAMRVIRSLGQTASG
ncbi:peroxiredoxin [Immundisolibacter sp.]|uniref:peroxiredoxin n=1 Tax=Immundisolibacter sp. TaxID=1934948 RepID=UPI003F849EAD